MDGIPFHEGGQHAEHEHEHHVVHEAEADRGHRGCHHDARGHKACRRQGDDDGVERHADDGEQHARGDGHEHIVAGEAAALGVGGDALGQPCSVVPKHLVEALRPTETLVPGIAERDGLLVVEHGRGRVADALALQDGVGGELDVLGEQVPLPAAVAFDDLRGHEEARAGNGAAGVERQASLVEELRLTQEPHGVTGGDPVAVVVLGVTVAGGCDGAVVEGLVHLAEVVHVEHVVGVEDEIRLIAAIGILAADDVEAVIERVTLAHLLGIETREHDGTGLASDLGSVIGAIVGDDEHVDKLARVVLHLDRVDELADDRAFVARADDGGEPVVLPRYKLLGLAGEHHEHVVKLIRIADGERQEDAEVEYVHERDMREELI